MKTLCLVRHAKSNWDDPTLADFDRPLGARGHRDLPRMAAWLAAQQLAWDAALVSGSRRTRETFDGLRNCLIIPNETSYIRDALYLAQPSTLLAHIQQLPDRVRSVLLLNHNPGISQLRDLLLGVTAEELPTCALVGISFKVRTWSEVQPGTGQLRFEMWPKRLAG